MNYNKILTTTPEKVKDVMFLLQQLIMQREKLDKEISIVFNELYVLINSLPRSENVDLSIGNSIYDSLFDTP
jgi:hypothetical protein